MLCVFCVDNARTRVYNSRPSSKKPTVWRRRQCIKCGENFTTYEKLDLSYLIISKRNGTTEPYSRAKLLISMYSALTKSDEADALSDTVEQMILRKQQVLLSSSDIAATVSDVLKAYDKRAHTRYKSFQP